ARAAPGRHGLSGLGPRAGTRTALGRSSGGVPDPGLVCRRAHQHLAGPLSRTRGALVRPSSRTGPRAGGSASAAGRGRLPGRHDSRLESRGEHADRAQPTQPPAAGAVPGPVVEPSARAAGSATGGAAALRPHRPAGVQPGAPGPTLDDLAAGPPAAAAPPLSVPPPAVDLSLALLKLSGREGFTPGHAPRAGHLSA